MSDFIELAVESRAVIGKANRRLRHSGRIPAVVYGKDVAATAIGVDRHEFEMLMRHETLAARVLSVVVDGAAGHTVLVKDIQTDPVDDRVQHIDFLVVDLKKTIHASVAVHFVGESAGVKEGGVLTHNILEVEVEALPTDLPDSIDADITELSMGDSITVSDLTAPDGVTILTDPETTVCSVTMPTKVEEPVEELEELEEGEVPEIGEGEEGEEAGESEGAEESWEAE